jgi:uncharacterized protein (TIGR03067 family)
MFRSTLLLLALTLATTAAAPRLKDPPAPATADGRWTVERYEHDGQVRDAATMTGYVMVHTKTASTLELNGRVIGTERVSYSDAGGVHRMDFTSDQWAGVKRGIWKVEGDTLTECEAAVDGDRPTDFTAPRGSRRSLWVLKRVRE